MKFVVYTDDGGSWRWRLVASNGQTVGSSGESFSSRASAQHRPALAAAVVKETGIQ